MCNSGAVFTYLTPRVHKSQSPCRLEEQILYGGVWYLWNISCLRNFPLMQTIRLEPRILRWLLDFFFIDAPLSNAHIESFLILQSDRAHVSGRECRLFSFGMAVFVYWRFGLRYSWQLSWAGLVVTRLQFKCDSTRWRTEGEVKGGLANAVCSQHPSHYLGTWCIQHYYRWCAHLGCQKSTVLTPPPI